MFIHILEDWRRDVPDWEWTCPVIPPCRGILSTGQGCHQINLYGFAAASIFCFLFSVQLRKIINYFLKISWQIFIAQIVAIWSVSSDTNSSSSTWKVSSFFACGFFHAYFHVLQMHSGGAKMEVNAKVVQDFFANYILYWPSMSAAWAQWLIVAVRLNLAILKLSLHLPLEEKILPHSWNWFSCMFFLRCRTAFVGIIVEGVLNLIMFKVAYISFSCFTFNFTKVIGIKVTGWFSVFCLGGFSSKYVY